MSKFKQFLKREVKDLKHYGPDGCIITILAIGVIIYALSYLIKTIL